MSPFNLSPRALAIFVLVFSLFSLSSQATAAGLLTPRQSHLQTPDILSQDVKVTIENGYAITQIDQVFFNPNVDDIEAIYSFPVPEKAAVGEFTYWIDGQPITGEVVEAARAKQIYETEKASGNETAIVEKNSFLAFESSVYPVRGQQRVQIRLVYIQPVHLDSAVGHYVYPLEEGGTDEAQEAFWQFNNSVKETFSFHLTLRSGFPLNDVRLPGHSAAVITKVNDQEWTVEMSSGARNVADTEPAGHGEAQSTPHSHSAFSLDKDIVLYWRLAPNLPGAVDLVTYHEPGSSQGTFMLSLTPGDDLEKIQSGRDWVFVLDFSGSMQGKYATLIDGMQRALSQLPVDDRFRIFLFNQSAWEVTNGFTNVDSQNIQRYSDKLFSLHPDGSTNLYAGLKQGLNALDSDRVSGIVLVTDGVANVGVTEKKAFLKLLEDKDVRLFTMIMGNGANRPLLNGMTRMSQGFAMNVSNGDDVYGKVLLAAGKLSHTALRDIELDIRGVRTSNVTPTIIGSLYHGQQLTILGKYFVDQQDETATMKLRGKIGDRKVDYDARLRFTANDVRHPELERLWAYATVEHLQGKLDYLGDNLDTRQALVEVAIDNSLVTNHTSMIVVRDDRFKQYNIERSNRERVKKENSARQERANQPVSNNQQQAGNGFKQPRAYPVGSSGNGSGGGMINFAFLVLLLPLLFRRWMTNV